MTDPREERELEAFLAGESPVSKRYAELGNEAPPPGLDANILADAEQELKVVPLQRKWRRWGAAVGVAATLVLAVSLVLQLTIQPAPMPETTVPMRQQAFEPEPEAKELAQERSLASMSADRSVAAVIAESPADTRARVSEELRAGARQDALGSAGTLEQKQESAGTNVEELVLTTRRAIEQRDDVPLAVTSAPARKPAAAPPAEAPVADRPAASAPQQLERIVVTTRRHSESRLHPDTVTLIRDYLAADDKRGVASAFADTNELREEAAQADTDSAATAGRLDQALPDADTWLAEVVALHDAGDSAAAADQLNEFVLAYPEHPVTLTLLEGLD